MTRAGGDGAVDASRSAVQKAADATREAAGAVVDPSKDVASAVGTEGVTRVVNELRQGHLTRGG